jgi:ABC-type uncharacterized transport system substrate-binding protein
VPIVNLTPNKLALNLSGLPRLQMKWEIPPDLLASAAIVIDAKGQRTEKERKSPAGPQASAVLPKKWRIHLVELVNAPAIDETEQGIRKGLKEASLVEGRDYELKVGNAQGDLPTLNTLIGAARDAQADMVYTITTPALQAAMQEIQDRPLLFALALDPLLIGDRGTHEKHRPNVAGVYDRSPFE